MAPALNDNPLISQILLDYAKELSRAPAREALIIVAHGPEEPEDNVPDLALLRRHAEWIAARAPFASVFAINIQDDAIKPIRTANVRTLRRRMESEQAQGRTVLVVPAVLASHGIQATLRQDLRGLEYRFQEKGLSAHPRFTDWVLESVRSGAKRDPG
jgi:hypothetical protein